MLLQNVFNPTLKRYVPLISDGAFIIEGQGFYEGFASLFFLEIDLSTEPLGRIAQKYSRLLTDAQKCDLPAVATRQRCGRALRSE